MSRKYLLFVVCMWVVFIICAFFTPADAKQKFYTLRYIKKDGTLVTESFHSLDKCRDQEMYLEMVEKQIIKSKCR